MLRITRIRIKFAQQLTQRHHQIFSKRRTTDHNKTILGLITQEITQSKEITQNKEITQSNRLLYSLRVVRVESISTATAGTSAMTRVSEAFTCASAIAQATAVIGDASTGITDATSTVGTSAMAGASIVSKCASAIFHASAVFDGASAMAGASRGNKSSSAIFKASVFDGVSAMAGVSTESKCSSAIFHASAVFDGASETVLTQYIASVFKLNS